MQRRAVIFAGLERAPGVLVGVDMTRIELPTMQQQLPPGVLFGVDFSRHEEDEDDAAAAVLHFAYACGAGVWVDVRGGVEVLCWDASTEELCCADVSSSAREKAVSDAAFGAQLCAPQSEGAWAELTKHITGDVLAHAGIPCGTKVLPGALIDELSADASSASSVVPFFAGLGRVPVWSALRPPHAFLAEMTPAQRTTFGYDASERLEWVLTHNSISERALVGEFQLAFVCFLLLASQSALEHWKGIIRLLCACGTSALERRPWLFEAFLAAAAAQFARCDLAELLADPLLAPTASDGGGSLVEVAFRGLFESLAGNERLRRAAKRFRAVAVKRCGFDPARSAAPGSAEDDAPTLAYDEEDGNGGEGSSEVSLRWTTKHAKTEGSSAHVQRRTAIEAALDAAAPSTHGPLSFNDDDADSAS